VFPLWKEGSGGHAWPLERPTPGNQVFVLCNPGCETQWTNVHTRPHLQLSNDGTTTPAANNDGKGGEGAGRRQAGAKEQERGSERVGRGTATPTGQRSPMGCTHVMDAAWMRTIFRQRFAWSGLGEGKKREKFSPGTRGIYFCVCVHAHALPGALPNHRFGQFRRGGSLPRRPVSILSEVIQPKSVIS